MPNKSNYDDNGAKFDINNSNNELSFTPDKMFGSNQSYQNANQENQNYQSDEVVEYSDYNYDQDGNPQENGGYTQDGYTQEENEQYYRDLKTQENPQLEQDVPANNQVETFEPANNFPQQNNQTYEIEEFPQEKEMPEKQEIKIAAPVPIKNTPKVELEKRKTIKKEKKIPAKKQQPIKKQTHGVNESQYSNTTAVPSGRFLGVDVDKIGFISVSIVLTIVLLLFVLEISSDTVSSVFKDEKKTAYQECKDSSGKISSEYPFKCVDGKGNIFYKKSTLSQEKAQLNLIDNENAKNGIISLEPKNKGSFKIETTGGDSSSELRGGIINYSKIEEGNKNAHRMVVTNSNLPAVDNDEDRSLESKLDNFIGTGQGLTLKPYILDYFKFSADRNFGIVEIKKITKTIAYDGFDTVAIFYSLDGDREHFDTTDSKIAVRVLTKQGDNYVLLEKYMEDTDIEKVNKGYKESCYKGESTYAQKTACYISKIKTDTNIQTKAEEIAFELIGMFPVSR